MANPNIVSTASIFGRTDVLAATSTATAITSNPVDSGKIYKINNLSVANVNGTAPADVNVDLYRSSTAYHIAKTISVPPDASIAIISKENTLYLLEGDSLRVAAGGSNQVESVCSYEEIG